MNEDRNYRGRVGGGVCMQYQEGCERFGFWVKKGCWIAGPT
jgi:hypothetical protein